METKNCLVCSSVMVKKPTHEKRYWEGRKYCSLKCMGEGKRGENHHNWNGGQPLVKCKQCGLEFINRHTGKDKSSFCSKSCNATYHLKGNTYRSGLSPINKGVEMPKEQKQKLSIAKLGKKGEKSNAWKGGITTIHGLIRGSLEYKNWRKEVFRRDNYTCQHCNARSGTGKRVVLHADHIKPFSTHPELRLDINNGKTLCASCHIKTPTFGIKALKYAVNIFIILLFSLTAQAQFPLPFRTTGASSGNAAMISRWPMTEGTGTTAADIISARNLTLTNGPTWGTSPSNIVLDGTNDYLTASSVNFGFNNGTEFSLSFWIKSTDASGRIIQKQIVDGFNTIYSDFGASGGAAGKVAFSVQNSSLAQPQYPVWYNTTAVDGNWHHFVFTFKKNAITSADGIIYIDGTSVAVTYTANFYASDFVMEETSNNLVVGARAITFTDPLAANIRDVRVYNRMLTATEVAAIP